MRDITFLVADLSMREAVRGFLTRDDFHRNYNLRTRPFEFDPNLDLFYAAGLCDPGLYTDGHRILAPLQQTYHRAIVIQDAEWDGSPGAAAICAGLTGRIVATGWPIDRFRVICINPELETWIWQRNNRVAARLGFRSVDDMISEVRAAGLEWPDEHPKPTRPKEALEAVVRRKGIGWSSAVHRSIAASVSLNGCQDPALLGLREALQEWFPSGDGL